MSSCMRACHQGPPAVLQEVRRLLHLHPHVPDLGQKVSYLCKGESSMQYPRYPRVGLAYWQWECGKCQQGGRPSTARMGRACGFQRSPVNPMLALRTAVCSDEWEQAWAEAGKQRLRER